MVTPVAIVACERARRCGGAQVDLRRDSDAISIQCC